MEKKKHNKIELTVCLLAKPMHNQEVHQLGKKLIRWYNNIIFYKIKKWKELYDEQTNYYLRLLKVNNINNIELPKF